MKDLLVNGTAENRRAIEICQRTTEEFIPRLEVDHKIDWASIIQDITLNYGLRKVAKETGIAHSALSNLRRGRTKEPRFTTGCKLMSWYLEWRDSL